MTPVALRSQPLRRLFLAQIPADFADWLDFVAIGTLLAFVWDAPAHAYAFLAVGMGAPYLVVGPFAGALVDRLPLRRVLVLSNLGRAVATAALCLAPGWPVLVTIVALRSAVDSFFTPAKQAAIQALTHSDDRASANGLSHGINQASKIVAPGAGGALLIWMAPGDVFLVNAVVSLLAAALSARLAVIARAPREDAQGSLLGDVRQGLAFVRGDRVVRSVLILMAAIFFAIFIYDTFIAPLAKGMGFAQQHLGFALAAVGGGGVLGAVVFSLLPELKSPQRWIAAGTSIGGALLLCLGLGDVLAVDFALLPFLAVFFGLGIASAMSAVPMRVVLQNTVPETRMGAVTALGEAANTVALLTAPFAGALLYKMFSVGAPFIAGGVVSLLAAVAIWRLDLGGGVRAREGP